MKYLLLALIVGCTTSDPEGEDEAVGLVTSCLGQWCSETAPTTDRLKSVWAVTPDDVFAVGDNGTIIRRNNDAWTAMTSGTTQHLHGVWAASSSDVWAVGVAATVLHFDGTQWSAVSGAGTLPVDAVWGSGSSDVWMCGGGRALHWDGQSLAATPIGGTLLSVSGTGPNDVWVSGENTNLHRWNGTSWSTVSPGAGTAYPAVLAISTTDVWATTPFITKETTHLASGRWTVKTTGGILLNGMSAFAATDVWGVGQMGKAVHWNGTAWQSSVVTTNTNINLWSVTTVGGHAWVVGDSGTIAHRSF